MIATTDEQRAFSQVLRRFLEQHTRIDDALQLNDAGELWYDPALWARLAGELGLSGLAVVEELGGQGAGLSELCVAAYELGARLVPSPFLPTTIASLALGATEDPQARRWLEQLAGGQATAAFVQAGPALRAVEGSVAGEVMLDGTVEVTVGGGAEVALVVVELPGGSRPGYALCPVETQGLTWSPLQALDLTRGAARLRLSGVSVPVAPLDLPSRDRVRRAARLVLAAERAGAHEQVVQMAAAHGRSRVAFGQPIGAFQAVKHTIADRYADWEISVAALRDAVAAHEAGRGDAAIAAVSATLLSLRSYRSAASDNIQIHGGMGVTWEFPAHLYYRHSLATAAWLGTEAEAINELGALIQDAGVPARTATGEVVLRGEEEQSCKQL